MIWYVYVHKVKSGPRFGDVFYVGKGSGHRSNSGKRNFIWHRVVKKYGYISEIVREFSIEEEAYSFERSLTDYYIKEGNFLANISLNKGSPLNKHMRDKMAAARTCKKIHSFVHDDHGIVKCTQYELTEKYGIHRGNLNSVVHGRQMSSSGWYMEGSKVGHAGHGKIYSFTHEDEGLIKCTQSELVKSFNLNHQSVSDLVQGRSRSHRGWTIYGVMPGPKKNIPISFFHEEHGKVTCTQAELIRTYGLNQSHLNSVALGKRKSHKGWMLGERK